MGKFLSAIRPRLTHWTTIRWIQLVFGLFLLADYVFSAADLPVLLFGMFLLGQAIFDWQLCGSGRCGPGGNCDIDAKS